MLITASLSSTQLQAFSNTQINPVPSQTCIIWAEELNSDRKAIGLFLLGCLSSFSKVLALGWHPIVILGIWFVD